MQIPPQYNSLMPYLILHNTVEFLGFMKNVFGATEQMIVPRDTDGAIMHGEIRIGDAVIMFANATEQYPLKTAGIFLYVENVDDTYAKALAAGATSTMLPTKVDYGYTSGFRDPFGNDWWPTQG